MAHQRPETNILALKWIGFCKIREAGGAKASTQQWGGPPQNTKTLQNYPLSTLTGERGLNFSSALHKEKERGTPFNGVSPLTTARLAVAGKF